jgi:hypothetical protein
MIPADSIVRVTAKPGVSDAIEGIFLRHTAGGVSELTLEKLRSGSRSLSRHESRFDLVGRRGDPSIYVESLLRAMATNGLLLLTFTPLNGMTDICRDFLERQDSDSGKYCVQATWDAVPHLTPEARTRWKPGFIKCGS